MQGIIIASIKFSDLRLLASMNRRLLFKPSHVWSKSEGIIKLTKALSFKRGLRSSQDFCQQSRLQRLLSPFLLICDTRNGLSAEAKSFLTKNCSSKALPNGKCGARNTCTYFIVVLFYSTDQSSSSYALFYWIGILKIQCHEPIILIYLPISVPFIHFFFCLCKGHPSAI